MPLSRNSRTNTTPLLLNPRIQLPQKCSALIVQCAWKDVVKLSSPGAREGSGERSQWPQGQLEESGREQLLR